MLFFISSYLISFAYFWHLNISVKKKLFSKVNEILIYSFIVRLIPIIILMYESIMILGFSGTLIFLITFYLARISYFRMEGIQVLKI